MISSRVNPTSFTPFVATPFVDAPDVSAIDADAVNSGAGVLHNAAAGLQSSVTRWGKNTSQTIGSLAPAAGLSTQTLKSALLTAGASLYATPAFASDGSHSPSTSPLSFFALSFIALGMMKRNKSIFLYLAIPATIMSFSNPSLAPVAWMWSILGWMWSDNKAPNKD